MKMLSLVRSGVAALALCGSTSLLADSLLNGLAIHKELGKELFIGALYTDQLSTDSRTLLQAAEDKRLELRVTTKRLSARRLNNLWIEGMAINNSPTILTAEAENMVHFTTLLRGKRLKQGDILSISSAIGEGTKVELNGVEMGSIDSDEFGTLLLSTWVGSVPLSSDFRNGLLQAGEISSATLMRFEEVAPTAERRAQVAQWKAPKTPKVAVAAPIPPVVSAPAKPASIAAPIIAAPVLQAPAASPEPEIQAPEIVAEAAEPAVPEAQAVTLAANTDADSIEDEILDAELGEDELEEEAPLLTAESLLSRQLFHSKLLKWTYQHIHYPSRAVERGQEGSVRISVIIDRNGNVLESTEVEKSRFKSLNKAAMRAVRKATPFPAIPDDIQGEQFAFSLPVIFRLPD